MDNKMGESTVCIPVPEYRVLVSKAEQRDVILRVAEKCSYSLSREDIYILLGEILQKKEEEKCL